MSALKVTAFNQKTIINPDGSKGKVLFTTIDFSESAAFECDFRYFSVSGPRTSFTPRSITIDNSNNAASVSVTVDSEIKYPHVATPGQIRTFQIPYSDAPSSVLFSSTLAGSSTPVNIYFFDSVLQPDASGSVGSNVTVTNASIPVEIVDPALVAPADGINPATALPTDSLGFVYIGGNTWDRKREETQVFPFSGIVAAGDTAILPAGNFRVFGVSLYVSGDAVAAGDNEIDVLDGSAIILKSRPNIPATAIATLSDRRFFEWQSRMGYVMTGNQLNLNIGTALTAGNIYGFVNYGAV